MVARLSLEENGLAPFQRRIDDCVLIDDRFSSVILKFEYSCFTFRGLVLSFCLVFSSWVWEFEIVAGGGVCRRDGNWGQSDLN